MRGAFVIVVALACSASASADSLQEHDYLLNCAGCHRIDGSGSSVVPPLRAMKELAGQRGVREYWVRVPGAAQAPLSDARLAALLNWLVTRFTGAPPVPAYAPEEVGRLRAHPFRDPLAHRPGQAASQKQ
jgi:mono/diheme cytochrome c family protein